MLYTLTEEMLPTYYRPSYRGDYQKIHFSKNRLASDPVTALHYHDCMELGICLTGRGVNYVENRRYDYAEGDLQVVPAGIPHLSKAGEGETRWLWISLSPARLLREGGFVCESEVEDLEAKSYSGVFHPWEHPELAALIHRLGKFESPLDSLAETELVFLVGQLLVACARIGSGREKEVALRPSATKIRGALDHIREHYAEREAMTESAIAASCGMSVSHFRAVFRKETGMAPKRYVIRTRLAAAAHALQSSNESILQIALASGFGQISSFNRAFRDAFGQTPGAFRRVAKKREE